MDITSVVAKNIDEYLTPKFPIYKIKYCKAIVDEDEDLTHIVIEKIVEEKIFDLEMPREVRAEFSQKENVISPSVVKEMKRMGTYKPNTSSKEWANGTEESIIIFSIERLA